MTPWVVATRSSLLARGRRERAQGRSARPDDELADPADAVLAAARVLRGEPLVVVVVAVDHDVGAGVVERRQNGATSVSLPCSPELKRGWCQIARVQRAVDAARSALSQRPWAEPAPTAADRPAVGIEDDDVPRPEVVRVPARAVRRGGGREVAEVAGEILRLPVVVAGGRSRPILEHAPGRVVAVPELVGGAVLVGVVAGGEDGSDGDALDELGRGACRRRARSRRCRRLRRGSDRPRRSRRRGCAARVTASRRRGCAGKRRAMRVERRGRRGGRDGRGTRWRRTTRDAAPPSRDCSTSVANPNSRIRVAANATAPTATVRAGPPEDDPDGSVIATAYPSGPGDLVQRALEPRHRPRSPAGGRSRPSRTRRSRRRGCSRPAGGRPTSPRGSPRRRASGSAGRAGRAGPRRRTPRGGSRPRPGVSSWLMLKLPRSKNGSPIPAYSQSMIRMRVPSSMKFALSRSLWQGRSSIGFDSSAISIRRPTADACVIRGRDDDAAGERERPVRLDDAERHEQPRDRRAVVDPAERIGDAPQRRRADGRPRR